MISSKVVARQIILIAMVSISSAVPLTATAETVSVDTSVTFNTVTGWEAAAIWEDTSGGFYSAVLVPHKDRLAGVAVNQLGLNRIRLELQSGAENPVDYWQQFFDGVITRSQLKFSMFRKINDNADPNVANAAGFQFTNIDYQIDNIILPMKQKLEANGESIYISLNLVDFDNGAAGSSLSLGNNPAEYAELINQTFEHVSNKYGIAIDALEIILEPDNTPDWSGASIGTKIGNNLVAAVNLLNSNGYSLKEVIAPSNSTMDGAISAFDQMIQVPGVLGLLTTINYHKYGGVNNANRQAVQTRAQTYSLKTAMLEKFSDSYGDLITDLRSPRVSSYQRWAYAAVDDSAYIFTDITNPSNPVFEPHPGVHAMAQVFKYVRQDAMQIDMPQGNGVAYLNANGVYVAVFRNTSFGPHSVSGLPAGNYGITSTGNDSGGSLLFETSSPDVTIGAGEALSFSVPTTGGLVTVYSKSIVSPDTTAPNPPSNANALN